MFLNAYANLFKLSNYALYLVDFKNLLFSLERKRLFIFNLFVVIVYARKAINRFTKNMK